MAYSLIKDLDQNKGKCKLKVRIPRIWDAINIQKDETLGLEMVFIDEDGDQIQAFIWKDDDPPYRSLLKEGGIYEISSFTVVPNKPFYRSVDRDIKIKFYHNTTVKEIIDEEDKFKKQIFDFLPYNLIHERFGRDIYLTDVVGKLTSISQPEEIIRSGKSVSLRKIEITDLTNNKLQVVIWANVMNQISEFCNISSSKPIVLVITSTTVKCFQEKYYLSSTSATKIYVNFDDPQVTALLKSINKDEYKVQPLIMPKQLSLKPELAMFLNRKTIQDINDISSTKNFEECTYTCNAKISKVITDKGWSYISCKLCRKKLRKQGNTFFCEKCNAEALYPISRYQLFVQAEDSTGTAVFVLFDKEVEKLFNNPVSNFETVATQYGEASVIKLLEDIVGNSYIFQIKLNDFNRRGISQNYTVTKVYELQTDLERTSSDSQSTPLNTIDTVKVHKETIELDTGDEVQTTADKAVTRHSAKKMKYTVKK